MSDHTPSLADLRRDIDVLDDQILDLLRRRAEAVQRVAAVKRSTGDGFLRPGREAQIIRHLVARHRGALPAASVSRIWREMIAALYPLQAPAVKVAVHAPNKSAARWDLARDWYGSTTPLQLCTTVNAVMRAISAQPAALGVMAQPEDGEKESWWPQLASRSPGTPRVIGRLPFVPNSRGSLAELDAYVIANAAPEDSGEDRSLLVLAMTESAPSIARISALLAQVGLEGRAIAQHRRGEDGARILLKIEGFMAADDSRLAALMDADRKLIDDAVVIGAYAVPLPADPA
jgi:chorismate mutase/prephenate dehydratase